MAVQWGARKGPEDESQGAQRRKRCGGAFYSSGQDEHAAHPDSGGRGQPHVAWEQGQAGRTRDAPVPSVHSGQDQGAWMAAQPGAQKKREAWRTRYCRVGQDPHTDWVNPAQSATQGEWWPQYVGARAVDHGGGSNGLRVEAKWCVERPRGTDGEGVAMRGGAWGGAAFYSSAVEQASVWRAIDGYREHQGWISRPCGVPPGDVRRAAERAEDKRREREAIAGAARAAAAEARGAAECADAARREGDAVAGAVVAGAAVAAEGGGRRVRARLCRAPGDCSATAGRVAAARVAASRSGQCVRAGQLPPEMWCLVAEFFTVQAWGLGRLDFVCTTILQGVLMRRKARDKPKRKRYRNTRRMTQAAKAYALGLGPHHCSKNVDPRRVRSWIVRTMRTTGRPMLSNAANKRAQWERNGPPPSVVKRAETKRPEAWRKYLR